MVSSLKWQKKIVRFGASRLGSSNKEELKTGCQNPLAGLASSVPRGHLSPQFLAGTPSLQKSQLTSKYSRPTRSAAFSLCCLIVLKFLHFKEVRGSISLCIIKITGIFLLNKKKEQPVFSSHAIQWQAALPRRSFRSIKGLVEP